MGFTPQQVGRMTLWEFSVCVSGWQKSQGVEEDPQMPDKDAMRAALLA